MRSYFSNKTHFFVYRNSKSERKNKNKNPTEKEFFVEWYWIEYARTYAHETLLSKHSLIRRLILPREREMNTPLRVYKCITDKGTNTRCTANLSPQLTFCQSPFFHVQIPDFQKRKNRYFFWNLFDLCQINIGGFFFLSKNLIHHPTPIEKSIGANILISPITMIYTLQSVRVLQQYRSLRNIFSWDWTVVMFSAH